MGVMPDALSCRPVDHRLMPSSSRLNATHVEVIIEEGGIRGVVRDSTGCETPFRGWLGLVAAVEACRPADEGKAARLPPGDRDAPSSPG